MVHQNRENETIWIVSTSCSNAEGILVRSGEALSSEILGRLAPKSRVRELQRAASGRVQYEFLSGATESPKIGWVSSKANGKDLLLKEERSPKEDVARAESKDGEDTAPDNSKEIEQVPPQGGFNDRVHWEVVGSNPEGLLVRTGSSLSSKALSSRLALGATVRQLRLEERRLHYELLTGEGPRTGWVSLTANGHRLLKRIVPKTPKNTEKMVHTDYSGVPRGACTNCRECHLWQFHTLSSVEWGAPNDTNSTIEDRRQSYDRKMRGYQEKRKGLSAVCECCGCVAERHLDLTSWLEGLRQAVRFGDWIPRE
eukprot:symbB.v1.2.001407.t1/scaffold75.1/size348941/13